MLHLAGSVALAAAAYSAAAVLTSTMSAPPILVAPIRLSNGILVAALLLSPRSVWWAYLLAMLPINLISNGGLSNGVPAFIANGLEIVTVASIIRSFTGARTPTTLDGLRSCAGFVLATLIGPLIGAFVGALAVVSRSAGVPLFDAWRMWFLAEAVGIATVVPSLLAAVASRTATVTAAAPASAIRVTEISVIGIGIVIGSLPTISPIGIAPVNLSSLSLLYVPFPFLVWAALRFGPAGAASANVLLAGLSVVGARQASGVFAYADNPIGVFELQQFLLVACATAVTIAGLAEERRQTLHALRQSESKFERAFRSSPDAVTVSRLSDGLLIDVNEGFERITGVAREEALGRTTTELDVWEDAAQRDEIARAVREGRCRNVVAHIKPRGGPPRVVLVSASAAEVNNELSAVAVIRDVTEEREAAAALARSERQYRTLFESTSDIVFALLPTGELRDINPAFERATGWQASDWLGRSMFDLLHPDEVHDTVEAFRRVMAGEASTVTERRIRTSDGQWLIAEVDIVGRIAESDGPVFIGVVRDITERRRSEVALRTSQELFAATFRASPYTLTVTGLGDSRIIDVNEQFSRNSGYSREEAIGRTAAELGLTTAKQREALMAQLMKDGRLRDYPMTVTRRTGEVRQVELAVELIEIDGTPATLSMIRDITDQVLARSEQDRLELEVQQARKMEAVGQLAGGIAHDFNNILQAIVGFSTLALDDAPPGSLLADSLDKILLSADRAQTLTQQLLMFSRREYVRPKVLDVPALIVQFSEMLRRVIPTNISFSVTSEAGTLHVLADQGHLEQIVMNLCVNARDAMPAGGRLSIDVKRTSLDQAFASTRPWARPGDFVVIGVEDAGQGMDAETLPHIFEPFFTTKDVGRGTGLGLATVYGIVKRYDGLIDVTSQVGRGTTFRIFLPVYQTPLLQDLPRVPAPPLAAGHNELVLFAEDEPLVHDFAAALLVRAGYRVLAARSGAEAIALFETHASEIEIAFLDVMMPNGDGRAVCRAIRARRPELPVLFATGYPDRDRGRAESTPITDPVIQKPYSSAKVLSTIRELLNGSVYPTH